MKILEAAAYVGLRDEAYRRVVPQKTIKALELAQDILAEAKEREQPFLYHSPESWKKRWLPSKVFRLMMLPLNAAALPCDPKGPNLVLKKIHAREEKPIIVDYNRNGVGATLNGFTPQVIVIDGKHRFKAAGLRGDTHILAWVGEVAIETMHFLGGSGGGPAPERTTPAAGARLIAKGGKKMNAKGNMQDARLAMRQGSTYSAGGTMRPITGPATRSESALRPVMSEGARLKTLDVDKIHGEFQAACKKGYKPRMQAVHPPGCEDTVKGLKKKFGNSDSTYKIAWWMKDVGRCG